MMMEADRTNVSKHAKRVTFFVLFLMMSSHANLSAGYDYKFDTREYESGNYEKQVADKLERGLVNTGFGWTEMAHTPIQWAEDDRRSNFGAIFVGIPYGILRAVGRTLTGVYEVTTSFVPQEPIFDSMKGDVL